MRILKYTALVLAVLIIGPISFLYLAPAKATDLILYSACRISGLERKEITLPDGLRYVYYEGGAGEPLMLLHGFGADKSNFLLVAPYLTSRYRVIIPDHIGFGESSHPAHGDYSPSAQARRLRSLAGALGIHAIHLGGNSMGGHIAMAYASIYPKEVRSLWLLDPGGVWSAPESEFQNIVRKTGRNPLMARSEDEFAGIFKFTMSDPPLIPRPMLNILAQERIRNFSLENEIFQKIRTDSIEQAIGGSTVPTLIVFGTKDRVINPAAAEILHRLMPRSNVVMMNGIGHLPMLEEPKQCADDYLKFRASLGAGRKSAIPHRQ